MARVVDEEEFTYASLVNRWRRERASTILSKLDETFYDSFDAHLRTLHETYQREQKVNPAAAKVLILLDELTNLQRIRDDLYDLRERKVVTAAVIAARDGKPDHANMTRGEKVLFDGILRVLREARANLLKAAPPIPDAEPPRAPSGPATPLDPVAAPPPAAQAAAPLGDRGRGAEAAPERAFSDEEPADRPAAVGVARTLIRVKAPVEPFVAPDLRHYRLQAEDVAAVPREVAHLLIQRGLATALGG